MKPALLCPSATVVYFSWIGGQKNVSHFSHNVVATEALKNTQQQMNITGKELINSCSTRWNSTYEMLDRILKLWWPITAVLSDETVKKSD